MRKFALTLIFVLLSLAGKASAQATPILCPNAGQTGNNANCQQPPVLTFGKQVNAIASAVETVSYNNCSSTTVTLTSGFSGVGLCNGTGSVTISSSSITGTNASDFSFSGGTCANGTPVTSGSFCTYGIVFTPGATGSRSATLTVNDTSGTHTLSLTGTGIASAATLTAANCGSTLTAGTNYRLSGNVTCSGSGFTTAGNDDINLQGFTLTYCNTSSSSFVQGIHINGDLDTIHNGTISEGAGNCTGLDPQGFWGSGAIEQWVGGGNGDTTAFNLTINVGTNVSRAKVFLDDWGTGDVLHDIIYTNNATYNSPNTAGRSANQGYTILQYDQKTGTGETFYNITGTGGTQGAMSSFLPSTNFSNNLLNPGNASNATTNDFSLQIWGDSSTANSNIITGTGSFGACVTCRGVQVANANSLASMSNVSVQNNTIITTELPNNNEYGGCQIGGSYASQFNFSPLSNNTMSGNSITAVSHACSGYGYGDSGGSAGNQINNSTIACNHTLVADTQGCHAIRMDNGQYYGHAAPANITTYTNDTFIGDSGAIYIWYDGTGAETFIHPTFSKGPNPVSSGWLLVDNCSAPPTGESGCGGPIYTSGLLTFIDPVFQNGATESANNLATQGGSASYVIQFTETPTIKNGSGSATISGATIKFTDATSATYTCTTDSTGQCSTATSSANAFNGRGLVLNENKYATSGITHYNNYSLQVTATGFTTYNASALNCTATNSATCSPTINMSGGTATDLYYAQTSAGANNGTSCANAYSWTDATNGLGVAANWVAGNTYHMCGTFTGAAPPSGPIASVAIAQVTGSGGAGGGVGGTGYALNDVSNVIQSGASGGTVKITGFWNSGNSTCNGTNSPTGGVCAVTINAAGTGYTSAGPLTTTNVTGTGTGLVLNVQVAGAPNGFSILGSGTSGSPITVRFEPGANFTAPAWGSVISATNQSFIVIDGGTNGTIQNTANGTDLTYQQNTGAVGFTGGSNIEVKNLKILNMYVKRITTPAIGEVGRCCSGIVFQQSGSTAQSNLSAHDNTIDKNFNALVDFYQNVSGVTFYNNTISNACWGIAIGDNNTGAVANGVAVYNNDIHDMNWYDLNSYCHDDNIFFYATNSTSSMPNPLVYNNYLHGVQSPQGTAYIYLSSTASPGIGNITVFNNIIQPLGSTVYGGCNQCGGLIIGFGLKNASIYNNTFIGGTTTTPTLGTPGGLGMQMYGAGNTAQLTNNIFWNMTTGIDIYQGNQLYAANNVYFGNTRIGQTDWNGSTFADLTSWRNLIGNAGSGYAVNDVVTVVEAGASGGTATVTSVNGSGAVTGLSLTTAGTGYQRCACQTSGGSGTGLSVLIFLVGTPPSGTGSIGYIMSGGEIGTLTTDPLLNSTNYTLTSASSSAYGLGQNLSSLGITPLNSDKPLSIGAGNSGAGSNARTSRWDSGVYQFTGSTSPVISISPSPLAFGNVNVGSSSTLTATVSNTGTASETLSTPYFTITGANAADFTNTGTGSCANGGTIAVSGSCTILIKFTPSLAGAETATLNVSGTVGATDSLTGTGVGGAVPNPPTNLTIVSTSANQPYQNIINWTASSTPSVTYNIYRVMSINNTYNCPASGAWPLLTSGVSSTTYTDSSLGMGIWCYQVTAFNGSESTPLGPTWVIVPPQIAVP